MYLSAKRAQKEVRRVLHASLMGLAAGLLCAVPGTQSVVAQEGQATVAVSATNSADQDTPTVERAANEKADMATLGLYGSKDEEVADSEDGVEPRIIAKSFLATAYCLKGRTASGLTVRRGIIAADPRVLPIGSVVRLEAGKYSGIYTVMDTGGAIRGNRIDIYLPTRREATNFGARKVKLQVLRHGWEPDVASAAE